MFKVSTLSIYKVILVSNVFIYTGQLRATKLIIPIILCIVKAICILLLEQLGLEALKILFNNVISINIVLFLLEFINYWCKPNYYNNLLQ